MLFHLQTIEVLIKLTPKEHDQVVHRAKRFKWEGNFLPISVDKWMNVIFFLAQNNMRALCSMFMKSWAILVSNGITMHLHFIYNHCP
jgi:hypothetical protein